MRHHSGIFLSFLSHNSAAILLKKRQKPAQKHVSNILRKNFKQLLNLRPKNENNQNIIIYNEVPTPQIADSGRDGAVSRDNPGQTELEQTIIRWNIDSEPQGARIYWRVVSNVPAEVKNTNELYLGPTPYEETRPFNILGLTYENSHNVQIEIKLTRRGYMDQIKRFNVRQAIDQQEISTFFELVPEETE